jgi:hypothetical protein
LIDKISHQGPSFAVEPSHLHLLDREVVGRARVMLPNTTAVIHVRWKVIKSSPIFLLDLRRRQTSCLRTLDLHSPTGRLAASSIGSVHHAALVTALRHRSPIRSRISPSNGRSRLGMAIVFLEGGLSPIPVQMASAKLHRGHRRGVCQFAHWAASEIALIAPYGNRSGVMGSEP